MVFRFIAFALFLLALVPAQAQQARVTLSGFVQDARTGEKLLGAAVYVAEHVPDERRGFYTSFIQITATLGLFLSLLVVLFVQNSMSKESFNSWGWRIPFLSSALLIAVGLYIRMGLTESPLFAKLEAEGKEGHAPLAEVLRRTLRTALPARKRAMVDP